MVSGSVYGSRQIGAPGTVDRGAAPIAAPASPVKQSRRQRASTHWRNLHDAQRAPSATQGIADAFCECAQTISATPREMSMFTGSFETCDGSKNRRLRQCKISIREVLISVTLSVRGEVAERLKAAVC